MDCNIITLTSDFIYFFALFFSLHLPKCQVLKFLFQEPILNFIAGLHCFFSLLYTVIFATVFIIFSSL